MYKLRELEKKDLGEVNQWRNDQNLISLLGAPFRFINMDVDLRWYENYISSRGNCVRCAVVLQEEDKILGLVSLTSIDYLNQSAEFHIQIGNKANQGKGIGTFAVKEMLAHAFNNMNLHRIELIVLEENEKAKHLYEKCGFIYEGKKKAAVYKNGKYVDLHCYAILKEDYGIMRS
jgi:RimJ/RimL family protein N-acetyltransferase